MSVGPFQLLIILAIVILLFGTKKLRNIGSDLGGAIKNFRSAVKDGESGESAQDDARIAKKEGGEQGTVIEGEATREKDKT